MKSTQPNAATVRDAERFAARLYTLMTTERFIPREVIESLSAQYTFGPAIADTGKYKVVFMSHPRWVLKTTDLELDQMRWGTDDGCNVGTYAEALARMRRPDPRASVIAEAAAIARARKQIHSKHIPVIRLITGMGLFPVLLMERCDINRRKVPEDYDGNIPEEYTNMFHKFGLGDDHNENVGFRKDGTPVIIDWGE